MLATAPSTSLRNGVKAVELVQEANQLSGGQAPAVLGTLAAAYAEVGRFPEAVRTAQKALQLRCRKLTRLTNAFSKKFENFQAAVALNFAYYNFCKTNRAIRMTPTQAAGIESSAWTIEELIKRCGE